MITYGGFVVDMTLWLWGLYFTPFTWFLQVLDIFCWFYFIGECRWSSYLVCKFKCLYSRSVIKSFEYFVICTASCSLSLSLLFCGSSEILSLLVPPSQGLFQFLPFGWSGLLWDLFSSFHCCMRRLVKFTQVCIRLHSNFWSCLKRKRQKYFILLH